MGFLGFGNRDRRNSAELAAERRQKFMNTFGSMSSDGHGSYIEENEVLDHAKDFDLHKCPDKPAVVDDKDIVPPAPLWSPSEEAERPKLMRGNSKELSVEELKRREKFNQFFDKVPADHTEGPLPDRRSLEHCTFEKMPSKPAVDPMAEVKEKKEETWYDYSEVKLTPPVVKEDPNHQKRMETFSALYRDVSCNEHYTAQHA
jgi:hypothetical protein